MLGFSALDQRQQQFQRLVAHLERRAMQRGLRRLLRHRLKSVPVVDGDRVVGIVARRDLLRLVARGDDDVRADLQGRLEREVELLRRLRIEVADGVVTVTGPGDLARKLVVALARTVPGVVEVRSGGPGNTGPSGP